MAQIISAIIFYALMLGILIFVWLMWRESVDRRVRVDKAMLEAVKVSAESAREAAEAAKRLCGFLGNDTHA